MRPPVLVFFHGGYWQELSKQESAFAAPQCLARGIAYAAVDYTLAPKATLSAIVDECRAAVARLADVGPLVVGANTNPSNLAKYMSSGDTPSRVDAR